jgi:NAD(P)-dependent dehydrogenase (short-subunit alcohol dehydrogenase family)
MSAFAPDLLAGKVAYVAGGTRGMNLAIAQAYARHGAKVAVSSRDPERTAEAAASIRAIGGEALGLAGDVRDYDRTQQILREVADTLGPIDIVVAGQAGNFYAPVLGMSSNGFKAVVDIDLVGTFHVFRACYEHLRRPGATLLAITAPEAVRPLHFQAHVCAAKAGVNMLIRCLALEWGPSGVRVNGLSPGPIAGSWGMQNVASPTAEIVDRITQAVPLRRWGTNDDIARTALFLSSEASSYVTGTIVETDGGITIASFEGAGVDAGAGFTRDPRVRGPGRGDR